MIWNWDTRNTIVFSWWKTTSIFGFIGACLVVSLVSFVYEYISYVQRSCDQEALATEHQYASLGLGAEPVRYYASGRLHRSILYGLRTFLAIFMMLIMMTFNGFLILAIVGGAVIGHYVIGSAAGCH